MHSETFLSKEKEMEMAASADAYLDEYEKLIQRMNTPRVIVDNSVCASTTLVKVDGASNHALLLDAVQVLTDLDLSITKAYISSDGPYSMDVFHVTDRHGDKLTDASIISYIQHSLESPVVIGRYGCSCEVTTTLELTGHDRPGLLSEIFAVLSELKFVVTEADLWTHNGRVASIISTKFNEETDDTNNNNVNSIESRLSHLLRGTAVPSTRSCHADRRLHQMMFSDRDYENASCPAAAASVSVQNCVERGYSVVNVSCRNRPKLLFDVICTLTDMNYVVFHGTVGTNGDNAHQEFYVRHSDGNPVSSEAERDRVALCLQAAIERRSHGGLTFELSDDDKRPGLLSEVTRTFRENGLSVARAEVSAGSNVFHVTDAAGHTPDPGTIDAIRQRVGMSCLQVKNDILSRKSSKPSREDNDINNKNKRGGSLGLFYLGGLVLRNLYNLGLIRSSCS